MRVQPTPVAARQIREEARWWRKNRPKAPTLFRDEIRRAFRLIADFPEAGTIAEDAELVDVRRVLLTATQHYLYYRVIEKERIEVLAVWSTKRGDAPNV
jgi:plasmid stabilization system protein ParE